MPIALLIFAVCFQLIGTPPGFLKTKTGKHKAFYLLDKLVPIPKRMILINMTNPPRIYLKDQAAAEPPHCSCSQLTAHRENVLQGKNLALVTHQNRYHSRK